MPVNVTLWMLLPQYETLKNHYNNCKCGFGNENIKNKNKTKTKQKKKKKEKKKGKKIAKQWQDRHVKYSIQVFTGNLQKSKCFFS